MKFINKLERKYGKYAIHDIMKYFMFIWGFSTLLFNFFPGAYYLYFSFFSLDFGKVFHGQIWRLVTFIFMPYGLQSSFDFIFFALQVYIYLMIGRSLENAWGAFRFNLFFIGGILFNILGGLIYYIAITGINIGGAGQMSTMYLVGLDYLFQSMFFAFAVLYPNIQFLLFYIIPVKVKYLAILDGLLLAFEVFSSIKMGQYYTAIGILVALANFLIFFLATRNYRRISPREQMRKAAFRREVHQATSGPKHKCAVCGRTELDGDDLEFRYCSKCKGGLEYCQEHLFTHEHKK
ncbi:MAG: hypothetical protein IKL07_05550 [Clostridium sp.]|nr:hypothetical protein [Clostridium sp.]